MGREVEGHQRVPMIGLAFRMVVAVKRVSQFRGVVRFTFMVRCGMR